MRTSKTARSFIPVVSLLVLSISWISCNQSSTNGDATTTTAAADTTITGVLEMRPPGSLIPKDSAADWVQAYRRAGSGPFSTNVIVHHPDVVKYYMDSIFYKYTPQVELPKGYVWRVAFSPMFYKQQGGPKLSICLVPCIVNESVSPAQVFDFFTEMQDSTAIYKNYYLSLYNMIRSSSLSKMNNDTIPDGFIFDEGQLWP